MNSAPATATVAIILLTSCFSFLGFRDARFRDKYLFSVREILAEKQYYRLLTSALLHADWTHLLFNMVSLYLFGSYCEDFLGVGPFLVIYLASIVGGDLLSLWLHRHHEYRSYGASGGVCGVIFSFILLFPGSAISALFLPLAIPGWLYAILYLVVSFIALKRRQDNIGHDAHLGGAVIGFLTAAALQPDAVKDSPKVFFSVLGVAVLLFIHVAVNPMFLAVSAFGSSRPARKRTPNDLPRHKREDLAVDAILEKISQQGMESLTSEERKLLNEVSDKHRRHAESRKPESGLTI